ncbi:lipopolysaccharide assembly protein LapA domain-containing protein [Acidaminococcus timonensis]|jgi:lipopolysaccharide assembly protein A|uniref:lipopolysaccharide assembly protein LapA domain-containing protein n=1 Tax=Acidaminococcus timonensis TaxID=1871002 RepID=UPI003A5C6AD8
MLYAILMGLIALFIAIFAIQNAIPVEVSFLVWHFSLSLVLIILGCLLLGFILASLWTLKIKAGHYMKDRKLKNQLRDLEAEKAQWEKEETRRTPSIPRAPRTGGYAFKSGKPLKEDKDPIIRPFRPKE